MNRRRNKIRKAVAYGMGTVVLFCCLMAGIALGRSDENKPSEVPVEVIGEKTDKNDTGDETVLDAKKENPGMTSQDKDKEGEKENRSEDAQVEQGQSGENKSKDKQVENRSADGQAENQAEGSWKDNDTTQSGRKNEQTRQPEGEQKDAQESASKNHYEVGDIMEDGAMYTGGDVQAGLDYLREHPQTWDQIVWH